MEFGNPLTTDNVLTNFDFDSFLNENNEDDNGFDFGADFMEPPGEIGAQ